jgi:putative peptide zinc metalloprotease protein
MSERFLSDNWYRVAPLKPELSSHVRIFRQRYRGRPWYVLQDRASGRVHRFTPATYAFIDGMDGTRSVDQLWNGLAESLGDDAPTQDEVIRLLQQLHAADVLQIDALPDIDEAIERQRKQRRQKLMKSIGNPMALRLPLWDPQRFLDRSWPWVRWLFGPVGMLLWLVVVAGALVQAAQHWSALTENLADRVLALENLFWLWITYPVVKFCHEMAHGYALKRGNGEVHEMGLMFLVFAPVPYVDASAASAFPDKWQRIGVSAAGILAEVFLAALAMFVWITVEPGAIRAIAFNVMLIGGVSTLLFNANPLLRFDGYYMFIDWLEIPNLGQRSNQYLQYLLKRYVYGAEQAVSPGHVPCERFWMAFYAPVSWCYRLFVMFGIALFIAAEYFFIGVLLALWSATQMLGWPIAKGLFFVLKNAELDRHRRRAVATTFGGILLLVLAAFVPMPQWSNAEGVVWVPENAEVRAGASGFVNRVVNASGSRVAEGEPLLELQDADLLAELAVQRARIEQLEVQLGLERFADRLKAALTRQSLEAEQAGLARLEHRVGELVALAGREGEWLVASAEDLEGRHVAQGALLGYVVSGDLDAVRVVVEQEAVDLVRQSTRRIEVRLADRPTETYEARIVREVPGGSDELPSKALTLDGGGRFATDPRDPNGLKTLARTFQFDLALRLDDLGLGADDLSFGTRAYVRFEHEAAPLGVQVWRALRQLFLRRLGI